MKLERITKVGTKFWRAEIFANGRSVDSCIGDMYSTKKEAIFDAREMAASHDPEMQKRRPDAVTWSVCQWQVDSLDAESADGVGTAHSIT